MTDPRPRKGEVSKQQQEGRAQSEARVRVASLKSQQYTQESETVAGRRDTARAGAGRGGGGKRSKAGSSSGDRGAARPKLTFDSRAQDGAAGLGNNPSLGQELHQMLTRLDGASAQNTHPALTAAPGPGPAGGSASLTSHLTQAAPPSQHTSLQQQHGSRRTVLLARWTTPTTQASVHT